MGILFPSKSEKILHSSSYPASEPRSEPGSEPAKESKFVKLIAKLRSESENIEPGLDELYCYYRHFCYIFLPPDKAYVGEGYGFERENRMDEYERVGKLLAKM